MARNSLLRGVLFALVAGSLGPFVLFVLGTHWGLAIGAVFAVALHLLVIGSDVSRGVRAAGLSLLLGLPLLLVVRDTDLILALSAVNLGLCRSALLYRRSLARSLLFEVAFLGCGALVAWIWVDGGVLGWCAALWSFWLVQAGFSLTTSTETAGPQLPVDPFERAQAVAEAILGGRH
ncbi:MAG: hypothetical protein QM756_44830 [Polyangiaceae bacterium]